MATDDDHSGDDSSGAPDSKADDSSPRNLARAYAGMARSGKDQAEPGAATGRHAVLTVVFASMGTGIGLNNDLTKGIFDRFRSLPIARSAPLTGTILGDFFRYGVSITIVFAYGSLLGFRIETNPVFALAAVGLMFVFGFAVGWIWVLLGHRAQQRRSPPRPRRPRGQRGVAVDRVEHCDRRGLRAAGGPPLPPCWLTARDPIEAAKAVCQRVKRPFPCTCARR
jgi:hypothetical protein